MSLPDPSLPAGVQLHRKNITAQIIDRDFKLTFQKTIYRIPLASGGALCLVHKRRASDKPTRGAVLCVHGFGQNRYTWHTPYRSFVNYLAFRGYDVFNLELRGFGRSARFGSTLPDHPDVHFTEDIPTAAAAVRKITGHDRLFLMGHSLGGACCYAATPLIDDWVKGLITVAGLYRFAAVPGILSWASKVATVVGFRHRPTQRTVPLRWIGRTLKRLQGVMNSPLYRPIPLQTWYPGTIEPNVLSYVHTRSFEHASLGVVQAIVWWGRMGRVVGRGGHDYLDAFDALDKPLLVLAGSHDFLIPPAGAKPAYRASKSRDKTFRCFGQGDGGHHWGHIDLILGRDAPGYVWPYVADWLDER